ncbi:MAG: Nucleic acid-binding domain protein [Candidatus Gottesmanbacteria bacterium GW2011_GWC2_39_8]|uniref:Nucleic acid-binding domain protein n=1 Tax=Candidatus Gottesmanbacteria bacterium GW2011_GWC2_39_8 TaxID=1618450 RepID=A0A0G0Q616_9BACT|nr:MAG: Nucleic acid-binding domain protein [Candidatus Gottesmanbacteria bacterium GW2011_GWC2_39_8]
MRQQSQGFKKFFARFGVALAAIVLVGYFARVWFITEKLAGVPLNGAVREEKERSFPQAEKSEVKDKVISWQDASKHYNEYVTVEGKIVATHNAGRVCFLNFHPDYKRYFTAVIFESAFPRFPANPENYYYGKNVRVSGYIKEYNEKPEIILNDPGQIEVIE